MSISSLWPATAIKAFVTDKLGTPPSVMRTPDVFADAVLGIAEEKSDKSVWKFGSLVFCGLKVVHIWKQKDFLVKSLLLLFTMCFPSLSSDVQRTWTFLFFRLNGLALIDEDYLRTTGISDFSKYRCDPDVEPPRMMPRKFPDLVLKKKTKKCSLNYSIAGSVRNFHGRIQKFLICWGGDFFSKAGDQVPGHLLI